jgi:hypothetical protein
MKLDPRIVVPAALAAVAVALPSGASAHHRVCPPGWTPTLVILAPDPGKDRNGNFIVCHKDTPGQGDPTKDDHGVITGGLTDPDPLNWDDDPVVE